MMASGTAFSFSRKPRQLRLEQAPNLVFAETARAQPLNRCRHDRLARPHGVCQLPGSAIGADKCAGAVAELDDAFVLEFPVRLRDSVRIDDEPLGERPDTRQLLARSQGTCFNGVLHLLDQLQVDRDAGGGIGAEEARVQLCY